MDSEHILQVTATAFEQNSKCLTLLDYLCRDNGPVWM